MISFGRRKPKRTRKSKKPRGPVKKTPQRQFYRAVCDELTYGRSYPFTKKGLSWFCFKGRNEHLADLWVFHRSEQIVRVLGNHRWTRVTDNLIKRLAYHKRCPVHARRCQWVFLPDGSQVCAKSGRPYRSKDWRPPLAPTQFELTMLISELPLLAKLCVGIADGDDIDDLLKMPGVDLIEGDPSKGLRGYMWTKAANEFWEAEQAQRRPAR